MNVLESFQIIVEFPDGREALTFIEMQLDSINIWGCYPKSLHELAKINNPPYGCGRTAELAFQDLYMKLNPGIVEFNAEEFNAAISRSHHM